MMLGVVPSSSGQMIERRSRLEAQQRTGTIIKIIRMNYISDTKEMKTGTVRKSTKMNYLVVVACFC